MRPWGPRADALAALFLRGGTRGAPCGEAQMNGELITLLHVLPGVVDLHSRRLHQNRVAPQDYTSLCDTIGQTVLAQYTIDGEVQEALVMVGACAAND
jgi:hypothetical protein